MCRPINTMAFAIEERCCLPVSVYCNCRPIAIADRRPETVTQNTDRHMDLSDLPHRVC